MCPPDPPNTPDTPGNSPAATADEEEASRSASFPIVGVGASAGGLEALTALLQGITIDGLALVIVQHLAPGHPSLLPSILGRSSRMPVVAIADGMPIEAGRVYVTPPNVNVGLLHCVFHLMSPSSHLPIDHFFRSLAEDQGPKAVGIVLSGMGADGAQGLREIKARGGLAFAQDLDSAKFESMPRSAYETGVVDRVLPPEGLATELMAVAQHPYLARTPPPMPAPSERDALGKLFLLIRSAYRNDLSLYKPTTIGRRVERRMALHRIEKLADYVRYVQENRNELAALYQDVLISVTSFFRDPGTFDVIERLIVPRIVERRGVEPRGTGASIRIWVPGCASGEEAYSLGMCVLEVLDQHAHDYRIQIFGTDVDEDAIARARRGAYPKNIEADVSPERLGRFFVAAGEQYQVARRLRDIVVFSPQNVTSDAPFSRIDLVSCRNLLIYLQPPLQKKVLRLLHYALNPDGVLVLGSSETVGDCADLFSLVDRKNKIYLKKNLPAIAALDARAALAVVRGEDAPVVRERERRAGPTAAQIADRKLMERYGPPSVLVNENLDILQFRGDTGLYLAPAPGTATLNLLKLLRQELNVEVWRAAQQALRDNAPMRVGPLRLARDGETSRMVAVDVLPIHEPDTQSRCLLVIFEDRTAAPPSPPAVEPQDTEHPQARVRELEQELASTKEYLQATVEELEASNEELKSTNEELKSTNEELQSTNEELQSTNEELETAKEELQSTNEELSTMNDELQHRMTDLTRTSSDLDNLLLSLRSPVLYVDADLRVRRASDSGLALLQLAPSDVGRPLAQLKSAFAGVDLEQAVSTTIGRLVSTAVQTRVNDHWYEVRILPYRSPGGMVDGALLLLRDIDAEKRQRELVLDVEAYAGKLLAALPQPLVIVDKQLRVLWINQPFLTTFHVDAHATVGNLFQNLGSGQWAHPKLRAAMEATLATGQPFCDFRIEHEFEAIGRRQMTVSGSVVSGIPGTDRVLLLTIVPMNN